MKNSNRLLSVLALSLFAIVGLCLHFFRIDYPGSTVSDEAHFVTYAADYALGTPFEDIHPPLGKWIYSSILQLYPTSTLQGATFIDVVRMSNGSLTAESPRTDYGDFPYIPLRVVDSLFGVALAVALYFFMRSLDVGRVGSTLAAFFVTFDNAILLNTRLILLDGMFLFFGIAALALYFTHFGNGASKVRRPILAGLVFGLSLAVKLTGIVFIGPAVIALILAGKPEWRFFWRFALAGFAMLAVVWFAGTFAFSPSARLDALSQLTTKYIPPPAWQAEHPIEAYLVADLLELRFSWRSYTLGPVSYGYSSPWYFWPIDQKSMNLGYGLTLEGNPVTWFGSTLAVLFALVAAAVLALRNGLRRFKATIARSVAEYRSPVILLGGYILATLPFITFVHRDTFLYHYFPALLFALALLTWLITELIKVHDWTDLTPRSAGILCLVVAATIAGFVLMVPGVYGS